jgi:hypothetical protein
MIARSGEKSGAGSPGFNAIVPSFRPIDGVPLGEAIGARRRGPKGRKAVLYFYPKDDTSGCTLEAQAFNALADAFAAAVHALLDPDAVGFEHRLRLVGGEWEAEAVLLAELVPEGPQGGAVLLPQGRHQRLYPGGPGLQRAGRRLTQTP